MWRRAVVGLVNPFSARIFIFQTKHPECNEGESEEPTGKDNNESEYGRSRSSVVVLGLAKWHRSGAPDHSSTPQQQHSSAEQPSGARTTSTRDERTNICFFVDKFFVFSLNVVVGSVWMTSLVL